MFFAPKILILNEVDVQDEAAVPSQPDQEAASGDGQPEVPRPDGASGDDHVDGEARPGWRKFKILIFMNKFT